MSGQPAGDDEHAAAATMLKNTATITFLRISRSLGTAV